MLSISSVVCLFVCGSMCAFLSARGSLDVILRKSISLLQNRLLIVIKICSLGYTEWSHLTPCVWSMRSFVALVYLFGACVCVFEAVYVHVCFDTRSH